MKPTPKQIVAARAIAKADTGFKLKDRYLPPDSRVGPFESECPETTKWRLYLRLARAAIKASESFGAGKAAKKLI
jgi:hypothetical protein